jgi:hypothetical protein
LLFEFSALQAYEDRQRKSKNLQKPHPKKKSHPSKDRSEEGKKGQPKWVIGAKKADKNLVSLGPPG